MVRGGFVYLEKILFIKSVARIITPIKAKITNIPFPI